MATRTLPSLDITDDVLWSRLLAAFESNPDVYKKWLRQQLATYVLDYEVNRQVDVFRAQILAAMSASAV